MNKFEGV